jgi:hypothetical protein
MPPFDSPQAQSTTQQPDASGALREQAYQTKAKPSLEGGPTGGNPPSGGSPEPGPKPTPSPEPGPTGGTGDNTNTNTNKNKNTNLNNNLNDNTNTNKNNNTNNNSNRNDNSNSNSNSNRNDNSNSNANKNANANSVRSNVETGPTSATGGSSTSGSNLTDVSNSKYVEASGTPFTLQGGLCPGGLAVQSIWGGFNKTGQQGACLASYERMNTDNNLTRLKIDEHHDDNVHDTIIQGQHTQVAIESQKTLQVQSQAEVEKQRIAAEAAAAKVKRLDDMAEAACTDAIAFGGQAHLGYSNGQRAVEASKRLSLPAVDLLQAEGVFTNDQAQNAMKLGYICTTYKEKQLKIALGDDTPDLQDLSNVKPEAAPKVVYVTRPAAPGPTSAEVDMTLHVKAPAGSDCNGPKPGEAPKK